MWRFAQNYFLIMIQVVLETTPGLANYMNLKVQQILLSIFVHVQLNDGAQYLGWDKICGNINPV
ncbi:MAG TPA: hypothetical protein DEF48_09415 [Nostoc sp. UBA8866]|nr:hypothetical protein [Nostoc sp. UBA8866]